MKHILHQTLFSCLMLGTAFAANAQQGSGKTETLGTLSRIVPNTNAKQAELKSKEITKELAMPKNGEIYIDNNYCNLVVKTWDQPKVKISTTLLYESDENLTDAEWMEKANLSFKVLGTSVKIKSGAPNQFAVYNGFGTTYGSGLSVAGRYTSAGSGSKNSSKPLLTIYVPGNSKLDIESKYGELSMGTYTGEVNIDMANGNMDAEDFGKLTLRSKYGVISAGNIKTAEIELTNGRFSAGNIDDLDIDTKYATVELALAKKTQIRSTNDEYEIEEAGEINGRKNYGNLRITRLLKSIELEGANADVKIRNISPSVSLIKIDDKYADIRLPLKSNKNYSVEFTGAYSSVYGNFEKKALPYSASEVGASTARGTLSAKGSVSASTIEGTQVLQNITSLGNLTSITVDGIAIDPAIKSGSFSGTLSLNNNRGSSAAGLENLATPTITSVGTLSNLTVVSQNTPVAAGQLVKLPTPVTTSGTVSVRNVAASPNITTGTLSGGTFMPYSRGYSFASENDTPPKFSATVGDGKALKIELKCQNCTVDFK